MSTAKPQTHKTAFWHTSVHRERAVEEFCSLMVHFGHWLQVILAITLQNEERRTNQAMHVRAGKV
ncbi:hypothetical protein SH139x_005637 [Planctomycetaceae bacterium SH139]